MGQLGPVLLLWEIDTKREDCDEKSSGKPWWRTCMYRSAHQPIFCGHQPFVSAHKCPLHEVSQVLQRFRRFVKSSLSGLFRDGNMIIISSVFERLTGELNMKELIVKRLQHSPAPIKPPCSAKYLELASWERPLKPIYWMQPVVLLLLHPLCFMGSRITAFSQLFIQLQPRSNDLQVQVAPDSLLACSRNSKLFAAWLADEMKEEELRLKFAQLPRRYPIKCSHRQYLQSWLVTKTVSLVWYCQLFSHPQRFPCPPERHLVLMESGALVPVGSSPTREDPGCCCRWH